MVTPVACTVSLQNILKINKTAKITETQNNCMRKAMPALILLVLIAQYSMAQTKVFKEVSDEISSVIKIIKQDNATVGYLSFTRLEKATEDSFNYRISILDENLNDIGKVQFKEASLLLSDVSFEQDVLCLGYIKTRVKDSTTKANKGKASVVKVDQTELVTQFINLT